MNKLITIVGTNASGKSNVGIQLAKEYDGEIISADSRQVFKGFDLCCGKVTKEEAAIVPHHMIDIAEINEPFSVVDYQKMAYSLIEDIGKRQHLPFIVGGTGLYIDSVIYGYQFVEESLDYDYRTYLESLNVSDLQQLLPSDIKEYLSSNNSDYNNKRRLIRVLEKIRNGDSYIPQKYSTANLFDVLQIGITWPRDLLDQRIEERLKKRIQEGMIEEVKDYLDNGGDANLLYKLGLEYRYIMWYVTGKYQSIDEFYDNMALAIKQFSKRQMKWFKRDKSIHWIDMTKDYLTEARQLIDDFLFNI